MTDDVSGEPRKQIYTFTDSGAKLVNNGTFKIKTYRNKRLDRSKNTTNHLQEKVSVSISKNSPTNINVNSVQAAIENETNFEIISDTPELNAPPSPLAPVKQPRPDEGYYSAGSPNSNSGESSGDPVPVAPYTTEAGENISGQEVSLQLDNSFINIDNIEFDLIEDNSSSTPLPTQQFGLQLEKVGELHNSKLYKAFYYHENNGKIESKPSDRKTDKYTKKTISKNNKKRGPKRISLEDITDEEHKKNLQRCREYRVVQKVKEIESLTELEELTLRNTRLKEECERMDTRVKRAKQLYLQMIMDGRVVMIK